MDGVLITGHSHRRYRACRGGRSDCCFSGDMAAGAGPRILYINVITARFFVFRGEGVLEAGVVTQVNAHLVANTVAVLAKPTPSITIVCHSTNKNRVFNLSLMSNVPTGIS